MTASCGCVREAPLKNPSFKSSSQCAAALTAPVGHDRPASAGAHPQPEAMYAGSAPVIRLEGPLALGHGILLVVFGIVSDNAIRPLALRKYVSRCWSYCWPARSPGYTILGRSRITDFRATV
ncbi:hypothetical protein B586_20240 [Mycobacterium haemophilum DSM 44634]|nr:hypothetical protein B586_20240 [Mycobacterium haemophilum DSM 44634]